MLEHEGNSMTHKTEPTLVEVNDFLATLDDEQRRDSEILIAIMHKITGKPAVMWGPSIIGFGSQHYKYDTGREGDVPDLAFSPRKGKLSLYVTYDIERYVDRLNKVGPYKTGKACIYIKRLAEVSIDELARLIRQMYKDDSNNINHMYSQR